MAEGTKQSRRGFLTVLAGWATFLTANLVGLGGMLRFMIPNLTKEPPAQFTAGPPTEFALGAVDERFKESQGVWLVRTSEGMYALSTTCTHLGCTPNYLQSEHKFKCPCHGSGFYETGINFEGPAPRPLERYRILLSEAGLIVVDKSKKYQQEKGEWTNPEAFLAV